MKSNPEKMWTEKFITMGVYSRRRAEHLEVCTRSLDAHVYNWSLENGLGAEETLLALTMLLTKWQEGRLIHSINNAHFPFPDPDQRRDKK